MGKNKQKGPVWKGNLGPVQKQVKGAEQSTDNANAARFQWRATWVDLDGDWGLRAATCEALWSQIIPRLHDLESMTWAEIYGKKDGSTHFMPVENIERAAQQRLTAIRRGDYDTLFQINVRGGIRLWGIRDRAVFYLLWYDPNHTVYIQKGR